MGKKMSDVGTKTQLTIFTSEQNSTGRLYYTWSYTVHTVCLETIMSASYISTMPRNSCLPFRTKMGTIQVVYDVTLHQLVSGSRHFKEW